MEANRGSRALRRVRSNSVALVGLVIVIFFLIIGLVGFVDKQFLNRSLITTMLYDPYRANLPNKLAPPSLTHPMGTDPLGRDTFSRILYATQTSLVVAVSAIALAVPIGVLVGVVSGYWGGFVDEGLMRVMDIFLTLPSMLLALALVGIVGRGLGNIALAIAVVNIPVFARIVRGSAVRVKQLDFIESARAIGESHFAVIFRELLPSCLTPVVIQASFSIALAILWEAGISFLGVGVSPPETSWGLMLSDGKDYIRDAPWLSVFPGLAIMIVTLGCNLVGDGLRDALDPKYMVVEQG